jgi:hypothetical protein
LPDVNAAFVVILPNPEVHMTVDMTVVAAAAVAVAEVVDVTMTAATMTAATMTAATETETGTVDDGMTETGTVDDGMTETDLVIVIVIVVVVFPHAVTRHHVAQKESAPFLGRAHVPSHRRPLVRQEGMLFVQDQGLQ